MKQLITFQTKEEKELALSLFRIPLTFFSEDKLTKTKDGNTDDLKTTVNGEGGVPDKKIELSKDKPSTHVELDLDDVATDKASAIKPSFDDASKSDTQKQGEKNGDESETAEKNGDESETAEKKDNESDAKKDASSQNETSSSAPTTDSAQPIEQPKQSTPQTSPTSNQGTSSNSSTDTGNNGDKKKDTPKSKPKRKLKNKASNSKLGKKLKNSKLGKKLNNARKKANALKDKAKAKKDEAAKKMKDKFANSKAGKKANELKDKAKDKIANNPAAQKALGAVGDAKKVAQNVKKASDAVKNADMDKLSEAAGDTAVKVASHIPVYGKAIGAADKVVGQTKAGKKVKKVIGCACIGVGCIVPLLAVLIPILTIMAALSWISNLFGGHSKEVYKTAGENGNVLEEEDFTLLAEKANLYSLETLASDTVDKNGEHRLWYTLWIATKKNDKVPIQHAVANYMRNYYYYNEDMVNKYYGDTKKESTRMKKLIDNGYLLNVKVGDMTSFAYSFETLRTHYDLISLKSPASSPQRTAKVNGKDSTYYLYSDKHMQILEDVLNNIDEVKTNFSSQVYETWFEDDSTTEKELISNWLTKSNEKIEGETYTEEEQFEIDEMGEICTNCINDNQVGFGNYMFSYTNPSNGEDAEKLINSWENISLTTILDTEVENVFIPTLNEYRTLSLRTILEKTSKTSYDTEYYTDLVREILSDSHSSNKKLNSLRYHFTQKLTTLELMTYLLSYEHYSERMIEIENAVQNYKNKDMFNNEFLASFLTFSDIQYYIALASSTDPSLAYEIALLDTKESFKSLSAHYINEDANLGGIPVFSNWYATYYLSYQCVAKGDSYIVSTKVDEIIENGVAQQLFDKYNVYHGLYDDITPPNNMTAEEANRSGFFALFKTATGTDLFDFDSKGNMVLPNATLNKNGKFIERSFPIKDENAQISMGYGQQYSNATVAKYGLSHSNHAGNDYRVPSGTTVYATASGTAFTVRGNTGYGNYVKIVHDDGYTSYYAHGNGTFYVENGSRVTADQPIMQSGNSGNSTGPHLHFEVRDPFGNTVNPNSYVMGMA